MNNFRLEEIIVIHRREKIKNHKERKGFNKEENVHCDTIQLHLLQIHIKQAFLITMLPYIHPVRVPRIFINTNNIRGQLGIPRPASTSFY
jgi:hypothetical protein